MIENCYWIAGENWDQSIACFSLTDKSEPFKLIIKANQGIHFTNKEFMKTLILFNPEFVQVRSTGHSTI